MRGVTDPSKGRKTWLCSACPRKHLSNTHQHLHRILRLLMCCLLEAQLVANSKPRGSLPFGREKQFVSF